MESLFITPSAIVPILLGVLIAGVIGGIVSLFIRRRRQMKRRMNQNIQSLKMFNAFSPDLKMRKQKK